MARRTTTLSHAPARALIAAVTLAALTIAPAGPAGASAPAQPVLRMDTGGYWHVPLSHLGYGESVRLTGLIASKDLFVPVPEGSRPALLQATLSPSPDVLGGFLEARAGETVLATAPIQPGDRSLRIPLDRVPVRNGFAGMSLVARMRTGQDACEAILLGTRLDLNAAEIVFSGPPSSPSTVAGFFPRVLSHLRVWVPPAPSEAEASAALRIASATLSRYAGQRTGVSIDSLRAPSAIPASPSSPFERAIVVSHAAAGRIALHRPRQGTPILLVGGDADTIDRSSRALVAETARLAVAPSVQPVMLTEAGKIGETRHTFDALGLRDLQATGVGRMEIPLSFSQFTLGGSIRSLSVRVAGVHTPLRDGSRATLGILVNGVMLRALLLGSSGTFDTTVSIPDHLLERDTVLTARVDYAPPGGDCRLGIHPFTLQIDPGSYFDVGPGDGGVTGFHRFPQALRPGFFVAFDRLDLARLRTAADIVFALQRLAGAPLPLEVTTWDGARSSNRAAIFVGVPPQGSASLNPPLEPTPFRVTDATGKEVLRLDLDTSFAVLEAFESGGRDVLLLTGRGDDALMANLARGLATDPEGWFRLDGDVYLLPSDGEPVTANLSGRTLRAKPLAGGTSSWWTRARGFLFPASLVLALAILAGIYPRVVRRRPAPARGWAAS